MVRPSATSIQVATPERILVAAEREFSELGVGGAKLATIAQGAGITRASLLHHFTSKEALYEATVQRAFFDLGQALSVVLDQAGSFETRFRGVLKTFVGFCEERPGVARLIVREVIERHGPGRALMEQFAVPLVATVEEFILRDGAAVLRPGLAVRQALMRVISDTLVRTSSHDLRAPLWGANSEDQDWMLLRTTFFRDVPEKGPNLSIV